MGGPPLQLRELKLRLDLSLALSLFGQVGVPAQLYQRLRKPEWAGVRDRFDDRVDGDDDVAFILRSYLVGMINRLTRFKRDDVYATVCDFARESRRDLQYQ